MAECLQLKHTSTTLVGIKEAEMLWHGTLDVCDTIWKGFTQKIPGVKKVTMSYKQAAEAMAVFGVGSRAAQAEGLFKCADVNKNHELSRAEMLKFLQTNRCTKGKLSLGRQKVEAFRSVGKLFDELGAEGKEEVRMERDT